MRRAESGDYPGDLYLLVDRLKVPAYADGTPVAQDGTPVSRMDWEDLQTRLHSSVQTAFDKGNGSMYVRKELQGTDGIQDKSVETRHFVNRFEADGMTFQEPDEYMFSFNSLWEPALCAGDWGRLSASAKIS